MNFDLDTFIRVHHAIGYGVHTSVYLGSNSSQWRVHFTYWRDSRTLGRKENELHNLKNVVVIC